MRQYSSCATFAVTKLRTRRIDITPFSKRFYISFSNQRPHVLAQKKASLTRELSIDVAALWDLFLECLQDANAQCVFIIIDNIDVLGKEAGIDVADGRLVIEKLNALVQDETKLFKILLTAGLAADQAASSNGQAALTIPSGMVR